MGDHKYIFQSDDTDLATARLDQLEQFLDPATYQGLDRIGVPRGGRSLEIGAGRGSAALHMLARCGLGEVVATDIDTTWLERITHPSLRVVQHNILDDDLEPLGTFDLIHARLVVHHLGARGGEAIARAATLLNSGGTLFVEEPAAVNRSGRGHPSADTFEDMLAGIRRFSTDYGLDLDCGFSLPSMFRSAGLVDVDNEFSGKMTHGGDAFRVWLRTSYELTKETLPYDQILSGRTTEYLQLNDDPLLDNLAWAVVGTWGIKPRT
jgi:SAM-dependent methyltransferase